MQHHLVVLRDRYLDLMLAGRKRIECRLSSIRRPPFKSVHPGDVLWFKLPSRPIHAVAIVGKCRFHELNRPCDLLDCVRRVAPFIQAERGFFEDAAQWVRFASLIDIKTVVRIRPIRVIKRDQRAWVVLDGPPCDGDRIA